MPPGVTANTYTQWFYETDKLKIPSGGPRPTNSLQRNGHTSNTRRTRESATASTTGKPQSLNLRPVRGQNVTEHKKKSQFNDGFPEPPPAKRQKTQVSIASSSSDMSVEDPLSQHSPSSIYIGGRPARPISRPSSHTPESGITPNGRIRHGSVPEFNAVERMMNSSQISKKRRKLEDSSGRNITALAVSGSSQSPESGANVRNHVDITGNADQSQVGVGVPTLKESWKGTARQLDQRTAKSIVNGTANSRASADVSAYFRSLRATGREARLRSPEKSPIQNALQHHSPRLNDSFVADDGKRRGNDDLSSSPDQLTSAATTVGSHPIPDSSLNTRSTKTEGRTKKTNSMLSSSIMNDLVGMERSNIPTKFGILRTPSTIDLAEEAPPCWSLDVVTVNLPGIEEVYRSADLGLVHDESLNRYELHERGKMKRHLGEDLAMYPKKLHKVIFEDSGRRFRFASAKVEGEDNMLDIEIARESQKTTLVDRIQERAGFQVMGVDSTQMDKLWETRRKMRTVTRRNGTLGAAQPVERLPQKEPQENCTPTKANSRGPRTSLVGNLLDRATQPSQSHQPQRKSTAAGVHKTSTDQMLKPATVIDRAIAKIDPRREEGTNNLRRSTRSSGTTSTLREILSKGFDEPDVVRYSKTTGLGKKWKRPLTYPKTGKKQATIEFSDLERLDEGEFLNDSLVTFHMRYHQHRLEQEKPDIAGQMYFFSTYFYERLTDFQKGTRTINYDAVKRWTRNVDIFTYNYIVVPINESAHWYLAIICNLPALDRQIVTSDDDEINEGKRNGNLALRSESQAPRDDFDMGSKTPLIQVDGSVENGTRESFSKLSLESSHKHDKENAEAATAAKESAKTEIDDVDMLDEPTANSTERQVRTSSPAPLPQSEVGHTLTEDPTASVKTQSFSRKHKRKSNPPVTHVDPRRPLILTFDSLGAPHGNTIRFLKDYLLREMQEKRGGMEFDVSNIKGINAKNIPEQNNFSDCGLYMLGYLEKFIKDGPTDFIAKTIKRDFTVDDWTDLDASKMRIGLRMMLQTLHKEHEDDIRANMARRKSGDGNSSSADPCASSPISAIDREQADRSSKPTEPISSRTPQTPSLSTRDEALKGALPLDESYSHEADNQLLREDALAQQSAEQHGKLYPHRRKQDNLGVNGTNPIHIESQSQDLMSPEHPSSQTTVPLPNKPSQDTELPSVIEDSQDRMTPPPETPSPKPVAEVSPYFSRRQIAGSRTSSPSPFSTTTPLPLSKKTYSRTKDRKRRANVLEPPDSASRDRSIIEIDD